MSQAGLNRIWARGLLHTLHYAGAVDICIAPGSRSTPLALEALYLAGQHEHINVHTHFDERGLGFFALGIAKATKRPVIVIVTSGTAVANLLPATVESGLTREQLILLTSDRPPELVGVGANQAINQHNIFSSHVTQAVNLSSPCLSENLEENLAQVLSALANQDQFQGSLQINCPYPEPLYISDQTELLEYQNQLDFLTSAWLNKQFSDAQNTLKLEFELKYATPENILQEFAQKISKPGLIIIGAVSLAEAKAIREFANLMGWPVVADPQAGIATDWQHFDLWLQSSYYQQCVEHVEVIYQFGARLVSKRLLAWVKQQVNEKSASYWLVEPSINELNPDHLPQQRMRTSIFEGISILQHSHQMEVSLADKNNYTQQRQKLFNYQLAENLPDWNNHQVLGECQLAYQLPELLSSLGECDLFLGNSLMVRLVDMLTCLPDCEVFTNRGASGIDGLLATAAGVHRVRGKAQLCLLGDTSLLYDLNSLSFLTQIQQPFVLLVVNNDGGAIFDLLPVPQAQKEMLYQMPHGYQFKAAAAQFHLSYQSIATIDDAMSQVGRYKKQFEQKEIQSGLVLEVNTHPGQAGQDIQAIVKAVQKHVS